MSDDIDSIIDRHRQGPRERYMRKLTGRMRQKGHGDIADILDDIMDDAMPEIKDLDDNSPLTPEEKKEMQEIFDSLGDLLDGDYDSIFT